MELYSINGLNMSWKIRERNTKLEDLIFQTLDWYTEDIEDDNGFLKFTVYIFGINTVGSPISLKINDYSPFFFIEVPEQWDQTCIYSVKDALKFKGKKIEFLKTSIGDGCLIARAIGTFLVGFS